MRIGEIIVAVQPIRSSEILVQPNRSSKILVQPIKSSEIFCSNEYPQFIFLSRNKKNNVYPCKPQFYYIKVGLKGVRILKVCFRDGCELFCLSIIIL